ncbi:flavodoxin family protein [Halanaerobium sp. Z-7514]|uniref:Flavodoxin family protein n=1 Tax=Halanaerobium polyolivorans TaxID=2886943 RepID=A0AAW4WTT5_9FIRM|nr:flavodoxin family protein [Halanaerobium polyolivorans]MCC3143930.1 flavodoxin family protein [Halanaerobium polyolivorans]RQD77293.1 MAG: flavodoxin family protein [Halanaerobium sp. MSAO_Bac5]
MKILILNGESLNGNSLEKLSSYLKQDLQKNNFEVEEILLKDKIIADCQGCFKCWIKTPGICIIDDYGRETAVKVINSDIIVFLTPIVFGSYSYQLKKALDRLIPLISPYFTEIKGETHHKKRYKSYPSILAIAMNEAKNEIQNKIFKELVERNSINFHSHHFKAEVLLFDDKSIREKIEKIVNNFSQKVGVQNE